MFTDISNLILKVKKIMMEYTTKKPNSAQFFFNQGLCAFNLTAVMYNTSLFTKCLSYPPLSRRATALHLSILCICFLVAGEAAQPCCSANVVCQSSFLGLWVEGWWEVSGGLGARQLWRLVAVPPWVLELQGWRPQLFWAGSSIIFIATVCLFTQTVLLQLVTIVFPPALHLKRDPDVFSVTSSWIMEGF